MSEIIIYGSKYGSTKRYATELSGKTGIKCFGFDEVKDLSNYETIIYFGGLYAGGVLGLKHTIPLLVKNNKQTIIIVTVGLADTLDSTNIANINASLARQIPKEIYERAKMFYLRGGIDYSKLNFGHKTMMKLLYMKAKNLPQEEKTPEINVMVDTYNQKVDFVDFDGLNAITEYLEIPFESKAQDRNPKL